MLMEINQNVKISAGNRENNAIILLQKVFLNNKIQQQQYVCMLHRIS